MSKVSKTMRPPRPLPMFDDVNSRSSDIAHAYDKGGPGRQRGETLEDPYGRPFIDDDEPAVPPGRALPHAPDESAGLAADEGDASEHVERPLFERPGPLDGPISPIPAKAQEPEKGAI